MSDGQDVLTVNAESIFAELALSDAAKLVGSARMAIEAGDRRAARRQIAHAKRALAEASDLLF